MRRRPVSDGRVRPSDPWWSDRLDACVAHYWAWRGRRWLFDPSTPVPQATARMEAAREMCLRRHGVDPFEAGPPPGRDIEGRPT